MIEELKELKRLREILVNWKNAEASLEEQYKQTAQYINFNSAHNSRVEVAQKIFELEDRIKAEAVNISRNTGFEERDFGSVKIKEFTKVTITDSKLAVAWAALNAPMCLSLTKDFEKVAKTLELPFAKIEKEYKAQIATDLSNLEG